MNSNAKVIKSGAWYIVANFITKSMAFLSTPIFARLLTQEEYGLYSNYASWQNTLVIFVALNISSTFISAKFDYKDGFDSYISSTMFLSIISTLIWMVIINCFPQQVTSITGISIFHLNIMMIYILFNSIVEMFQARERYKYEYKKSVAISLVISIGGTIVSIGLVYFMSDKLTGRIVGNSLFSIVLGIVLGIIIFTKGKSICVKYWKYALPICLPYIPHLLSLSILNVLDRIMITRICGAKDNALYSLAYSCGAMVTLLITSMNMAVSPWLGEKLKEESIELIRAFSSIYVKAFAFLACGIMLLSPEVLLIMGGEQYNDALYVMPPVAYGFICQFIYTMYVNIEQFKKKTIGMAFASVSAAILNYVLNTIFIPRFGYIAAAYTTMISFLWLLVFHVILVYKMGYIKTYNSKTIVIMLIITGLFTIGVNFLYLNNVVRYVFVGIYFIAFIYLVKKNYRRIIKVIKSR